jgi:hypothetical protein
MGDGHGAGEQNRNVTIEEDRREPMQRNRRYRARPAVQLAIVLLLLGGMALFLFGAVTQVTGWMVLGALATAAGWVLTGLSVTALRGLLLVDPPETTDPAMARRGRGMFFFGALFVLLAVAVFVLDVID